MAYAPAGNTTLTPSLTHLATVYYNKKGLDRLNKKFMFREGTEGDVLPLRSGKTMQWYRYTQFAANTTPASEGTVGTSLSLTSTTVSATVSEYADYITVSALLEDTAIDPIVANAADLLGYRAGLTADTITRTEFDANASSVQLSTLGATLAANDFRRAVSLLEGIDVLPKKGEDFVGIIHPYALYDLQSDNTAGGFIDVMKYAAPQALLNGEAGRIGPVRLMKSTNVGSTGTAPQVKYYTYVIGQGAVGAVDLAGSGPSRVMDPTKQSFRINTIKGGPQIADPAGMIGSAVSYRFVYVAKTLDSTNYRWRIILSDSSII